MSCTGFMFGLVEHHWFFFVVHMCIIVNRFCSDVCPVLNRLVRTVSRKDCIAWVLHDQIPIVISIRVVISSSSKNLAELQILVTIELSVPF